jgi:hypothetical protein
LTFARTVPIVRKVQNPEVGYVILANEISAPGAASG